MAVVVAISFPPDPDTDPGVGGTWEADNGVVYQWDGVAWNVVSTGDDGNGDDIDLSGDVEIGTDCDDTLTVKSKAEFECNVDIEGNLAVEGEITMGGNKVALEKDLTGGGDLSGDVEIGTDCDDSLTVNSTAKFKCNLDVEGELTVNDDEVALKKDIIDGLDLEGDIEIGKDCSTGLKVNSTADFNCKLTGHDEIVLQGNKEGDNNLSIRPNKGDHSTNITTLNSGALRFRTHVLNTENDPDGEKKTHIALSRNEDGDPVTNIYHLPYPTGDKDNEPATVKFVLDNCGSGGGGGEVYLAPCGEEPESPALGSLWYQTDELNLKVRWSGTWLPVINRTDREQCLELTGGNLTGPLVVEDQETQGADGDDSHAVFHVKTIDASDQGGGLIVSQSGDVQAVGKSQMPQTENSFTTKKYLDETIEETIAAGNDHASMFLSKQDRGTQHVVGTVKYTKEENHNTSSYNAYRSVNNEFRLGNLNLIDPNGAEYDEQNFLSDAYRLNLSRPKEYTKSDGSQYEWSDQRVVSRCMDRIAYREDVKAEVRAGSRARGVLPPPPNFDGKKYTIVREVRWSNNHIHAGGGGSEGPMQLLQWVCDPDMEEEFKNLETTNVKLAPRETRAATVGWVEQKIVEAGVGKGSDLCADSEEGAELGGFWRDGNGRVYVKTS